MSASGTRWLESEIQAILPLLDREAVVTDIYAAQFRMFALYNRWANRRLYEAATKLPAAALTEDRGAFFSSVLGTLNHLLVADGIWLARLRGEGPAQYRLDEPRAATLAELGKLRAALDAALIAHIYALDTARLGEALSYPLRDGTVQTQARGHMLAHMFNHQAHHRGQAHDLICQIGGRNAAPVLDLIAYQRHVLPGDAP